MLWLVVGKPLPDHVPMLRLAGSQPPGLCIQHVCVCVSLPWADAGGIRRALFKLERGVCQLCHLDCHALVAQLQQIAKDSPHWLQHRSVLTHVWGPSI